MLLAVLKYVSLLQSSEFPAWYQSEIAMMYRTRFRFKEKTRPESYAIWVSEHMGWPVPREHLLTAPNLVSEWDESEKNGGLQQVRDMLEILTMDHGRAVLMAKAEEHIKLAGGAIEWQKEPIYGTEYKVEVFDEDLITEVSDLVPWEEYMFTEGISDSTQRHPRVVSPRPK